MSHDNTHIKTEYVFGAEYALLPIGLEVLTANRYSIPRESIEIPTTEHHMRSIVSQNDRSFQSSPSISQAYVAQTPEWQRPPRRDSRFGSSTPTPHANPWNIGVPGSAHEHTMMDMRATAPFEGWPHESQSPEPANRDGTLNDGLDNFMDRRSYYSVTPAAPHFPERSSVIYEEGEMER